MKVTYGAGIIPAIPMQARVARLERTLLSLPPVDCPVRHYFAPGLYAREISIPAGTVVTGAIHKTENLIVVSKGRLRIVTDEGTRDVAAGDTFTCRAGMKNAVVTLEDSRWTNFIANPTNETDTDRLCELFTESKASELLGGADNKQIAANRAIEKTEGLICHMQLLRPLLWGLTALIQALRPQGTPPTNNHEVPQTRTHLPKANSTRPAPTTQACGRVVNPQAIVCPT